MLSIEIIYLAFSIWTHYFNASAINTTYDLWDGTAGHRTKFSILVAENFMNCLAIKFRTVQNCDNILLTDDTMIPNTFGIVQYRFFCCHASHSNSNSIFRSDGFSKIGVLSDLWTIKKVHNFFESFRGNSEFIF